MMDDKIREMIEALIYWMGAIVTIKEFAKVVEWALKKLNHFAKAFVEKHLKK